MRSSSRSPSTPDDGLGPSTSTSASVPSRNPVPAPDGTGLYFATEVALQKFDVRFTALGVADADVPVRGVNGTSDELSTWISADACRLDFTSPCDSLFGKVSDRRARSSTRSRSRTVEIVIICDPGALRSHSS